MKNYFYKCVFRVCALILLLGMASSLFAISFNEQRKVIIPKYANAVYRDLTVLHKMDLQTAKVPGVRRTFLLEIGKRPTYFWNSAKSFHLLQEQNLDINEISYYDDDWNKNIFTIQNMKLDNGSFASEGLFLGTSVGSSITLNNNSSNLLLNYSGSFPINLTFGSDTDNYDFYSLLLRYTLGTDQSKQFHMDNLYLRDVKISGVEFPSPRMMVYRPSNNVYKAKGTAIAFELSSPKHTGSVKNYYGPWELYSDNKLTTTSEKPCGQEDALPEICTKHIKKEGKYLDTVNDIFTCVGETDHLAQSYDFGPEDYGNDRDWCYDYQEETVMTDMPYNDNGAFYEFKVEEVHRMVNGVSSLIPETQMPKSKSNISSDGTYQTVPFTQSTDGGITWVADTTENTSIFVDGSWKVISGSLEFLDNPNDAHPCLSLCDDGICKANFAYIRNYTKRELKSADASAVSMWPSDEGPVQDLYILNYTIGFCPKRTSATDTNYEMNYRSDQIEALLIKSGSNWVTPKVCMRRKVKCNSLTGNGYNRSYTLLSTDR